jgi:CheY-like chemotaxis protein
MAAVVTTVLCIDDNAVLLRLQKPLLEGKGYVVLTAPDGVTGIAISRNRSLDAVVLDFNMAGVHGVELVSVLMQEQPNLPVVISSGSLDEVPDSLKWFADALVQKGDGPEALLMALEKVLGLPTTGSLFNSAPRSNPT